MTAASGARDPQAGRATTAAPGERRAYHRGPYAAYVLDPAGNNVELVSNHPV